MHTWILASARLVLAAALPQQAVPALRADSAPVAAPPSLPPGHASGRDTLRLYAVGDLNLGWEAGRDYLLRGDTRSPFAGVRDTLAAADILFGNLESPIAPVGTPLVRTGSPVFSAPPVAADALVQAGFDVVSTANNHAWDTGLTGILETVRQLDRVGLPHAGTGRTLAEAHRPAIIIRKGWRVAVFAMTRAYNPAPRNFYAHVGSRYIAYADSAWLYPAIRRLKASGAADFVVVSVHAGTELADVPDERLRRLFEGAIDAGADLCLGHHPHVLQPVEWYHGKPIAYSLGNFIFRPGAPWTAYSGVFTFTVAPDGRVTAGIVPVRSGVLATFASGGAADSVRGRVRFVAPVPIILFATLP